MSCERIREILESPRDEASIPTELRHHAEECAACSELVRDHEDADRTLRPLTRIEPAQPVRVEAPRSGRFGVLSVVAAASITVLVVGIILRPVAQPAGTPSPAAQDASDAFWQPPVCANEARGIPKVEAVFRTDGGILAVLCSPSLFVCDDGTVWRELIMPAATSSATLIDGSCLSFLVLDRSNVKFLSVDIASTRVRANLEIATDLPGREGRVDLRRHGNRLYALIHRQHFREVIVKQDKNTVEIRYERERGESLLTYSEDAGASWTIPTKIVPAWNDPSFVATSRGLHLLWDEQGKLAHRISSDGGRTWKESDVPAVAGAFLKNEEIGEEQLAEFRATECGDEIHALCRTSWDRVLHFVGKNAGATWSSGSVLVDKEADSLGELRGRAGSLTYSQAELGVLASRDGGATWHREPVTDHVKGTIDAVAVTLESDGRLLAAFTTDCDDSDPRRRLFVRRQGPQADVIAPEAVERQARRLIEALDDESLAVRDEAAVELAALGRGILPALRAKSGDAGLSGEAKGRIRKVIERIEGQWPADKLVPSWWSGPVQGK